MSKKKNKLFIWTATLGTLGGVSLAGGGGFLIYYFNNGPKEVKRKLNLGNPISITNNFLKNTKIKIYPVLKDNNKIEQALTNKEMEKIFKRFKNEVPFGPEIFNLKSIIFDDVNFTLANQEQGVYSPKTNEIGISTSTIFLNDKKNNTYKNLSSDEKVDKVFQVLYHEYGHHMFYTYQNSVSLNSKIEPSIQIGFNKDSIENFPLNFVKWFKNDFNYGDNSKTFPKQILINASNGPQLWKPISSHHSLKQLYDYSNNPNSSKLPFENSEEQFTFYTPNNTSHPDSLLIPTITNGDVSYMYSLQELLTRKFELSTLGFSDAAASTIYPDPVNKLSTNTMFMDYAHYKTMFYNPVDENEWKDSLYNPTKFINEINPQIVEERFYKDDPFSRSKENPKKLVSEVFAKKLAQRMGQQDNSEVSLITSKNSFRMFTTDTAKTPMKTWKRDEGDNIKIGGYLKSNIKYKVQDIQNAKNKYLAIDNGNKKISDITTEFKDIKAKTYAFEKVPSIDIGGSDYFWSTNDFIKASEIAGKDLYLVYKDSKNMNQKIQLTTFKGDKKPEETGITSSRLDHYPESNNKTHIWKAIKSKDGGVAIVMAGM